MAADRGLPSVPQGLPRGLTVYLQNLHAYLLRLAGNIRGASETQAVRRSDLAGYSKSSAPAASSITSIMLRDASITEKKLADGAVTGGKIADATIEGKKFVQGAVGSRELGAGAVESAAIQPDAVTSEKLARGAVSTEKLMDGAVSGDKIEDGAVSEEKLASGLLTTTLSGKAEDGETVSISGEWKGIPIVCVTGFFMPSFPAEAMVAVEAANLRLEEKTWRFDAVARATVPADESLGTDEIIVSGTLLWMAIGRQ